MIMHEIELIAMIYTTLMPKFVTDEKMTRSKVKVYIMQWGLCSGAECQLPPSP